MLRGLRTAVAYVPDLAAARDWHADTFALAPYFDEPYYVSFAIGGFELGPRARATRQALQAHTSTGA